MSKEAKKPEETRPVEESRNSEEAEALTAQLIDHMRGEVLARRMIEEVRRENAALYERCGELEARLSEALTDRKEEKEGKEGNAGS